MKRIIFIIFHMLFLTAVVKSEQKVISPLQFGLKNAKTGEERYWILYQTHKEAANNGYHIKYDGIDTIKIDIPHNAKNIPLVEQTDFGNTVIMVRNNSKNCTLFTLQSPIEKYDRTKGIINGEGDIDENESFIVILEDSVPWVKKRIGYDYSFKRKDIIFINEGVIEGTVISSYSNPESKPFLSRSFVNTSSKFIRNLSVVRDSLSTYKTFIIEIENQYNVIIKNIHIVTPSNNWFGDNAIRFNNCYKVRITNTTIDGTYSQKDKFGYGISLINVSDVKIRNLKANADWGVFGNNNINNITFTNCDINRFDVHCYGKDFYFDNCIFRNLYNQFSSMFETVSFTDCTFIDFVPVLFESSYNAYTKFNLNFKNCKIIASKNRCHLISGGIYAANTVDNREELRLQEYPNIFIDSLVIIMPKK
ncbi:MAG: hypothetical protein ACI38V_04240 [Bacteroides sp.]